MTVLFAAGAGGDPERYRPLLDLIAGNGHRVVAPRFERLTSPEPPIDELLTRPAGLVAALADVAADDEVVGIGHSIGAWALLCLAGATPFGVARVPREPRIGRLVLFAPAAGWFCAPGALDAVTAPMLVFAGERDTVTPPAQALHLQSAPASVDVQVIPGAGHFSFMHTLPPGIAEEPGLDRHLVLDEVGRRTVDFLAG